METPLQVLHIDDNIFDRQLVRDALEQDKASFIVTAGASKQEFEALLKDRRFDVVLTDFNILGFEGLEVIDAVHKKDPTLPVIVVTGTGSEEIAVEAMKRGAADYVIKSPRHILRLPLAIQAVMERKQLLDERLRSEQALKSSEERLHAFANALPDLAFILDEDGRFVQALNAPQQLLYTPVGQRLGKSVHDVLPTPIADQIMEAIHSTIETAATQRLEYQLNVPAGLTWFEARTSLMSITSNDKKLVVYVARDISMIKEAELKLRRERNLLRTLIDNVPDHIFVTDRDGNFVVSNTAHSIAAGITPPQIIGRKACEVFSPTLAQRFHYDDDEIMSTGIPLINEERLIVYEGNDQRWVLMTKIPLRNEAGDVIGLVGISRDITDRLEAEEALRASEEHLRAVVSGTPVILFVLDAKGAFTLLQGHGLKEIIHEPDTFIGKSIFETLGNVISNLEDQVQLALAGEETGSVETIGELIFDFRYSPLRNKNGTVNGVIGIATDITERLRAEKLRIELEKEQEVIALKERFIATASHDFRTPLTIIRMSINMLETYYDRMSSAQRTAKLQGIGAQIDHMVQLLEDVLTLSKANAGKLDYRPETIDLKSFCEQVWDSFRHVAESTHTIDFTYELDWQKVVIDPNLMQYVLVNLLSNAIKYSPNQGHVCFEVTSEAADLVFRISDNGIGIPEQDQSKMFQPFHRAGNTQGISGTGLGLSIVKSYVEIQQGSITFKSNEGRGTIFTVRIPLRVDTLPVEDN